jgi:transcriptional regulator with XRE-family HTH domain
MLERNLNQSQLAKLLEIRQSQVSNLLRGKSLPSYYTIMAICEKFGVEASELLQ